jgi:multiple sugar transport system substrate-binding protein
MTIWGSDTDLKVYKERLALAKKAYPGITVTLQHIAADYDTKLQTMVAGGKAPDIMELAEAVNVYSSKGQLVDLSSYYKNAGSDPVKEFGQSAVDRYSTTGKLWAAPDRGGSEVLFYNKDLFDAAGVSYPTASWTWTDFKSAAQKLTKKDGDKTIQWGYAAGDWWPWYMNWMKQNGGTILNSNGQPEINSAANIEALKFYNDLVLKDRAAPSPRDYANAGLKNGSPDPLFAQGKLAMVTTGFWNVAALQATDLKWDVVPVWQGKQKATAAFGNGLAVGSSSKNKDAAAKIALFLSSAAGQAPIANSGQDVPANLAAAASEAFTKPTWLKTPANLAAFSQSAEFAYSPPMVPEWNEIQKAFTDGLAKVWTGDESVEKGLAAVQTTVQGVLAK